MKYLIFGGNGFVGRYLANKMIEQGKARYATRALIMELLNIIEWCSQLNPNTFEL